MLENRVLRKKFGSNGRLGNQLHNRELSVFKSLPYFIWGVKTRGLRQEWCVTLRGAQKYVGDSDEKF